VKQSELEITFLLCLLYTDRELTVNKIGLPRYKCFVNIPDQAGKKGDFRNLLFTKEENCSTIQNTINWEVWP
jgi:hypothetical protein